MKKIKLLTASLAVMLFGALVLTPVATVGAIDPLAGACDGVEDSAICDDRDADAGSLIGTIINTLLFVVGTLSVIMIIVAGILYVTSTGDSGRVSKAKNTLTYSIVGLIVSILAFAIVNWVLDIF